MLELNRLYNLDCMQGMKEFPDGFFDLAIVDPPYGIGIDGQRKRVCRNPKHNRKEHSREGWDNKPLFRKMALFLLHGVLAKRNRVDCFQKFRGQQHIQDRKSVV